MQLLQQRLFAFYREKQTPLPIIRSILSAIYARLAMFEFNSCIGRSANAILHLAHLQHTFG